LRKDYKPLVKFLLLALLCYITWLLLYEFWLHPLVFVDLAVIQNAMVLSKLFLNAFGYHIYFVHERQIIIESVAGLYIGDPCNGLNLFALFSGFILSYPGKLKSKIIFIPLGIIAIHLLNVARISFLLLLQLKAPSYMQFNHTFTFTIVVYGLIFMMWMYWVNRFGSRPVVNKSIIEI
jgi:exosortase family protein XrtF